jgi:hypothetical protein
MSAEAIYQVTQAFRKRLQQGLTAAGDPGNVFVGPLDDPDAQGASLILFLYRVAPNASLRNREHVVAADNPPPPVIVYRDALPLDLYYLVSVGTRPGTPTEEPLLRSLGYALQRLQIEPDLSGPDVAQQTVHLSLEPLSTEETSRVWALFPTANYRTSVAYLASPVWIDPPLPPRSAEPVRRDELIAGAVPAPAAP